MKAKIIDTIPKYYPIDFNGKRYMTNVSISVAAELATKYKGGLTEALSKIDKMEVAGDVVAALINNAIERENFENETQQRKITGAYVNCISSADMFLSYTEQIKEIVRGSMPQSDIIGTEVTGEDENIDDSDVPEVEEKN